MYGFDPTPFSKAYDPTPTVGNANYLHAKQLAEQVLADGALGSGITKMKGQRVGDKYLADAKGSAQSTLNRAGGVMGALDFAGNMGRGFAAGGFGGGGAVGGDGGAAAGLTTPWDKGYDFFKGGGSNFGADLNYDFGGMASNMGY